ncbi:hypothetical protein D3C75_1119750 [compost metagenome]
MAHVAQIGGQLPGQQPVAVEGAVHRFVHGGWRDRLIEGALQALGSTGLQGAGHADQHPSYLLVFGFQCPLQLRHGLRIAGIGAGVGEDFQGTDAHPQVALQAIEFRHGYPHFLGHRRHQ